MGEIKIDEDELLRMAAELLTLRDQVNDILIKTQNTESVLFREMSVSTFSQNNKLTVIQDFAYNLVRKFDKVSDSFYQAARMAESAEEDILGRITFKRMRIPINTNNIDNELFTEIKLPIPDEYLDYKSYFMNESKALSYIYTSAFKFITCKRTFLGGEINDLPGKVAYRKNGFLYIYELKATPMYNLFGTDFYGDDGVFEVTGDRAFADLHKLYKYECVYSSETKMTLGIILVFPDGMTSVTNGYKVEAKYSTLEERIKRVPSLESSNGNWTGERGNSKFVSSDSRLSKFFDEQGVVGLEYRGGKIDMSGYVKAEFKIENMTNVRSDNFRQADKKLANELNKVKGNNCTVSEVRKWRRDNNYTWHELNDMETIQLVPSSINAPIFKHLGGVGEYNIMTR